MTILDEAKDLIAELKKDYPTPPDWCKAQGFTQEEVDEIEAGYFMDPRIYDLTLGMLLMKMVIDRQSVS